MEARIKKGNNQTMKEIMELQHQGCWAMENLALKQKLGITEENIMESKYKLKKTLLEKITEYAQKEIIKGAENKSKMKYYLEGKQTWKPKNRATYMNKLTRNQASTIFKARTRMLKVKANYKNGNKDLKCRTCGKQEETQNHILEECEAINKSEKPVTKAMIFTEDVNHLKETAKIIQKRMEITEATKAPAYASMSDLVNEECAP